MHEDDCLFFNGVDLSLNVIDGEEYCAALSDQPIETLYPKIQMKPFASLRNNVPTKTAKVELHTISGITAREIQVAKNKQFLNVQMFHVILRSKEIREESFNLFYKKYPHKWLDTKSAAKNGFYYSMVSDIVSCYCCKVSLGGLKQ